MRVTDIDFNLYKQFIAVYENKNIAKASEQLVITPQAVGMRIKELERVLGVKLFLAHARGVNPTKEADELYKKIQPTILTLNNAGQSIQEFNEHSVGELRLGTSTSIASVQIIDYICEFMTKYPNVKLSLATNRKKEQLVDMLLKNDLDVIVHRIPFAKNTNGLIIDELCDHPRAFLASSSFLAKYNIGTNITLSQLKQLPTILQNKNREDIGVLLSELQLEKFVEIDSGCELIYSIVKRGVGIGYTNPNLINNGDNVKRITIQDIEIPKHNLGVIYSKDETSKLILTFVKEIKQYYKKT